MNAFSKHRLLFTLFIVSFLVACEICVADEWRNLNLSVDLNTSLGGPYTYPLRMVARIYWTPPPEKIWYYDLYANGIHRRATGEQIRGDVYIYIHYSYDSSGIFAVLRDYFSDSHTFTVVAHPLSGPAIRDQISLGPWPLVATEPTPPDGATMVEQTTSLTWSPSPIGVEHDIYFDDNFEDVEGADVNDTTGIYRGRQPDVTYTPSETLRLGQTYYWRIDEVGRDDIIDKGDVWSFTTHWPLTAYYPEPADGAKFIDPNVVLSWMEGLGAQTHNVYFGDNPRDVNDAVVGLTQATATYTPGTLELDKTYYWRVDEFDGLTTHKGDVWSFTTAPRAAGGLRGEYFEGVDLKNLVMTRIDPQINFNWGDGSPDPLVGADNFSVRWKGEVEAAFTETYTFYTNTNDGVRLWVNNRRIINNWTTGPLREKNGAIDLAEGQMYSIRMEFYESGGDAVAELCWSSPHTPKQLIPQGALSLPFMAYNPLPSSGTKGVGQTPILRWTAGDMAQQHDVYFGTDKAAVADADTTTPGIYRGRQSATSYTPPEELEFGRTYYWRVDEYNTDATTTKGKVWTLTVVDFLSVSLDTLLSFTTGGDANWFGQTKTYYYDGHAAQSGDISHGQESWMQTTVSGKGIVKFYWKVSSEYNYDFLQFYIDGSRWDQISGFVNWQQKTYTIITSSSHTLLWRYLKDEGSDSGSDCGWVDKVEWVPD